MTVPGLRAVARRAAAVAALALVTSCGVFGSQPPGEPVTPTGTGTPGTSSTETPGTSSTGAPGATGGSSSPSSASPAARPTGVPGRPTDVVTGLNVPWSVVVLPGGEALISLRDEAKIIRVDRDGATRPVRAPGPGGSVPGVQPGGEGGLLGLALLPDDATQLFVYGTTATDNRVTRWTLTADELSDPRVVVQGIPKAGNHNGGRIAFGPDGYLYIGTGDAGDGSAAQDRNSLGGKILRVTADGKPAPGNPFEASPVYSLGHRNVQGLGWSTDGTMYASEFGQNRFDELNKIVPGGNYGWPEVEGGGGRSPFINPLVTWTTDEASPSGLLVTGDAIYLAALRGERLWRVPLAGDSVGTPQAYLTGELGRLRDVVVAPDGKSLWLLTNNTARGVPRRGDDRLVQVPLG